MAGSSNNNDKIPLIKLTAIQYVIALILVILVSGLWRLQVLGAQNYRALAQANRIRKVPILAPRGKIYDRNGQRVFYSKGYTKPFDGFYQNQSLPIGTYYYIISPNSGRKKVTGDVTIIR